MSAIPAATRAVIRDRDQDSCVRCGIHANAIGASIHHRKRRRDGGHAWSNLVVLCGSGTTGCHGWATENPAAARADGVVVPSWDEPATTPILYRGQLVILGDDGSITWQG